MASKLNCWEFMKCGRQPGGEHIDEFGVCPTVTDTDADGLNHGLNGGRICWAVGGTFCSGRVEGTFAEKMDSCLDCEFFHKVRGEETGNFMLLKEEQMAKLYQ